MAILAFLLAVLVVPYVALTALGHLSEGLRIAPDVRGRVGLALLFLVASLAHFFRAEDMVRMLPPWAPGRAAIIHVTGLMELGAAVGLLVPATARLAGLCLIAFLVLVLPANVYAAVHRIDVGGHGAGPAYLLVRIPFQLFLLGWTWWFAVRGRGRGA